MPGLVDAREGQVAVLPHLAARVGAVGADGGVAGGGEGGGQAGVYGEGDEFAAVPWGGVSGLLGSWFGFREGGERWCAYQLQA